MGSSSLPADMGLIHFAGMAAAARSEMGGLWPIGFVVRGAADTRARALAAFEQVVAAARIFYRVLDILAAGVAGPAGGGRRVRRDTGNGGGVQDGGDLSGGDRFGRALPRDGRLRCRDCDGALLERGGHTGGVAGSSTGRDILGRLGEFPCGMARHRPGGRNPGHFAIPAGAVPTGLDDHGVSDAACLRAGDADDFNRGAGDTDTVVVPVSIRPERATLRLGFLDLRVTDGVAMMGNAASRMTHA